MTKIQKGRTTKDKDYKESLILRRQGSFALLRCFFYNQQLVTTASLAVQGAIHFFWPRLAKNDQEWPRPIVRDREWQKIKTKDELLFLFVLDQAFIIEKRGKVNVHKRFCGKNNSEVFS